MITQKDYSDHMRREWAISSPRIRMSLIQVLGDAGYIPSNDDISEYLVNMELVMEWLTSGLDDHCAMIEAMDDEPAMKPIDFIEIPIEDDEDGRDHGYI